MKKTTLIPALIALTALQAWAYYDAGTGDFGPYRDDEKTEQVQVKSLDALETSTTDTIQTQKLGIQGDPQAPTWKVVTDTKDPKNISTRLQLVRKGMRTPLQFQVACKLLVDLLAADLNGDGLPDYLLTFRAQPNGSEDVDEGERSDLNPKNDSFIVLLSDRLTYRAFQVANAYLPGWGVYRLGSPAQTALLASFDFKEAHLDLPSGTRVIFHLYQLISVKGSELALDNGLDGRFPKFVVQDESGTHKNHHETKLLTDERKKELLGLYPPTITEGHFKK